MVSCTLRVLYNIVGVRQNVLFQNQKVFTSQERTVFIISQIAAQSPVFSATSKNSIIHFFLISITRKQYWYNWFYHFSRIAFGLIEQEDYSYETQMTPKFFKSTMKRMIVMWSQKSFV